MRGNPGLQYPPPPPSPTAWSSAHLINVQQVGHPTCIIEGLACRLTLSILEQMNFKCNFTNSAQIQTLKINCFFMNNTLVLMAKYFDDYWKKNWLGCGWVGCFLQRSLLAQVKGSCRCQHWLRISAVGVSAGFPGNGTLLQSPESQHWSGLCDSACTWGHVQTHENLFRWFMPHITVIAASLPGNRSSAPADHTPMSHPTTSQTQQVSCVVI